nr:rust resistance kinase Lr10-like [Ipomoea trifida]
MYCGAVMKCTYSCDCDESLNDEAYVRDRSESYKDSHTVEIKPGELKPPSQCLTNFFTGCCCVAPVSSSASIGTYKGDSAGFLHPMNITGAFISAMGGYEYCSGTSASVRVERGKAEFREDEEAKEANCSSFLDKMGKGYFLHIPILVLFLALGYGYGYDPNECLPRKCGNNGPQISFPFRLKNMPPECGQPGFDLLCTDKGETALEIPFPFLNATQPPFPIKFFIEDIDYEYQEIVISGVDVCFPQLLSKLNLSASPFSSKDLDDFSFFSCSTHRNINATSIYIFPIACLTKPGHFIYAVYSDLPLYTVTELISCTKMSDISVPNYFLAEDNYEFVLRWTEPRRRPNNNSTAEDVDDCYGKCPSIGGGPLTKLKVAGEVLGSFLVVVIILVTYRIYRSNKMKKEDQVKIERFLEDYKALKPARYSYADIKKITDRFSEKLGEGSYGTVYKGKLSDDVFVAVKEPPSMPPNPFTSTDPSKAKANKPGKLFTSGLEIISELE